MTEVYAALIVGGTVQQVIVGTAEWAIENLGGQWIDSQTLVGIGWSWDEVNGFQPPTLSEEETM